MEALSFHNHEGDDESNNTPPFASAFGHVVEKSRIFSPSPMAECNALQRFPSDCSLSALARINHLFPDSSAGNRLRSWTAQTQINLWLSKENYNMAQENKIKGSAEREMSLPRAASISPVSPCDWRSYQFSGNKSSLRTISVWV